MKRTCIALYLLTIALSAVGQSAAPVATWLGGYSKSLQAPARVAIDAQARAYVTEPSAGEVVVFDAFGRKVDGRGGFAGPLGIAIDQQGSIYLAEEASGSVTVFDADWNPRYKLGVGDGEFLMPNHIAIDPDVDGGRVYVSDSRANLVKVYVGGVLTNQFSGSGQGGGEFSFPAGLGVRTNGEVFVVDQNNDRCQVFDRAGAFSRSFKLGATATSGRAQAAFFDKAGRFYVADTFQGLVKVFDAATGASLSTVGSFGSLPGQLASPGGLALDVANRLFVASANTRRVELFGLDSFFHLHVEPSDGVIPAGGDLTLSVVSGGAGDFACQWWKGGLPISGATNMVLAIPGTKVGDGGLYSVVVASSWGTFTSSITRVVVMDAPRIVSPPESQTVLRGANVVMAVVADGTSPSYQWRKNGNNISGAINRVLELADVQGIQSGSYTVVVSNDAGSVVSDAANLSVVIPPSVMEIVSSIMATNQVFHLTLNLDPGYAYALDASSDLQQWESIRDFAQDAGLLEFVDFEATNHAIRFYRLRWVP